MTEKEFKIIVTLVRGAYPSQRFIENEAVFNIWLAQLSDLNYNDVLNATKKHIQTQNYAPTIAQLRGGAAELMLTHGEDLEKSALEAWNLVRKAVSRSLYNAEAEFSKLPEVIRHTVGSPSNLREWAQQPNSTFESVTTSNFQRHYIAEVKREKERRSMNPDTRASFNVLNGGSDNGVNTIEGNEPPELIDDSVQYRPIPQHIQQMLDERKKRYAGTAQ